MKIKNLFFRLLCAAFVTYGCLALTPAVRAQGAAPAAAKGKDGKEEETGKSYLLSYGIVGLAVILGMLGVCRPRNRLKQPPMPIADQ